jgi:hypothetical protein
MSLPSSWLPRRWGLDAVLGALGILFGSVSFTYPFGNDQALYAYVAREWVERGKIPYRDVFDHKTPGIYAIHALTTVVFGSNEWGIRVVEMGCVIAIGLLAARLVTDRGVPVRQGLRGLSVLITSVIYFGFFDYWNTAQSEIWYGAFGTAAVAATVRIERESRAQLAAGALAGLAMVTKPPALWMVLLALGLLVARSRESEDPSWKRAVTGVARFGAASLAVLVATFGYFGVKGAIPALLDIVVGANGYYVKHEKGVESVWEGLGRLLTFYLDLTPVATFLGFGLVIGLVVSFRTKDRASVSRYVRAGLLLAAAASAVAMQLKFYLLHFGVMVPALVVLAVTLVDDILAWLETRVSKGTSCAIVATSLLALFLSTNTPWMGRPMWWHANERAFGYLTGRLSREQYTHDFNIPVFSFDYGDIDAVSRFIVDHSTADDTILVRGFNPEVYILTHRRYDGRFFWSNFLTDPHRAHRREAYLAEDREAFERTKPRFIVTLTSHHEGIESAELYEPLGYRVVGVFGVLTLLER